MATTLQPITETLAPEHLDTLIRAALEEDLGAGDVTTDALIPAAMTCRGKVICKQDGVICGLSLARRAFELLDERVQFDAKAKDGDKVQEDQIVIRLYGPARAILKAERVALNFLQHLSGIASMTARYVKAVEGTKATILDTRKTTPGLRSLEKYATRIGGADNHRFGLYDAILIKDTHLALVGGVTPALRAVRKAYPEDDKTDNQATQVDQAALPEREPSPHRESTLERHTAILEPVGIAGLQRWDWDRIVATSGSYI